MFNPLITAPYCLEVSMAYLEELHSNKNLPDEPYCGVAGLFNADLHSVIPDWAPREDWGVISPYEIRLIGETVVASSQA